MTMKKSILFFLLSLILTGLVAQVPSKVPMEKAKLNFPAPSFSHGGEDPLIVAPNPVVASKQSMDDPVIMRTYYDLMTNSSVQNRLYVYPDGSMGGVSTMSLDNAGAFTDRGTGYNYFNGSAWGALPTGRLENLRAGWPSYAPWNNGGEIVVSHHFSTYPLVIMTRAQKGTGTWTQSELAAPVGAAGINWPRMVTNGPGNSHVHIIALTTPVASGGSLFEGLDGALVYNRSLDGGTTWSGWELLDGMTSADYIGFSGDAYAFAEPRGDTLCFMVGDNWNDCFIMKSTNNGDTWNKTTIWNCPYNLWAGGDSTGIFYCPDGSNAIALDKNGMAHVLSGFMRARGDEAGSKFWYPWTDGLIYWNENMPELPQELDPDTLMAHGNYIGWVQDTMVFYQAETSLAYYYLSMSSMPTISIDDATNQIYAIYSSMTTYMDENGVMFRHIFMRSSNNLGNDWGDFTDLNNDFMYNFLECAYPFASARTLDHEFYVSFMADDLAGTYVNGSQGAQGQSEITDNSITILKPIVSSVNDNRNGAASLNVSLVFPNPATDRCYVDVQLERESTVMTEIFTTTGLRVLSSASGNLHSGTHRITIPIAGLSSGIYICRVKAGEQMVSRKLVVE